MHLLAFDFPRQVLFSGAVTGITYGVMAVGVLLVFRSARVANLAVGEMGGFAAALMYRMIINWNVPFWISLVTCVLIGAIFGAAIELLVIRRLFDAPRVILLVALIGVSQLLVFFQVILPQPSAIKPYPTAWSANWEIGGVLVRSEELLVIIVMPLLVFALAVFLNRTKYGLAVRASAANADAARLAGIGIKKMSTLVWTIAGAFAAIGAILFAPLSPQGSTPLGLGPGLLVRVLAVALLARMTSIPFALIAGVVVGIGESLVVFNENDQRGLTEALLFAVVLLALAVSRKNASGETGRGRWSFAPRIRPIPKALEGVWWVRQLPRFGAAITLLIALIPLVVLDVPSERQGWTRVLIYAMVALSLTVLTGWSGQLSLGQFAFVGLGGMTTAALVKGGIGFLASLVIASVITCLAAIIVGAPALRRPGLFLAIGTFSFAIATTSWLLYRSVFLGDKQNIRLPRAVIPLPAFLFDRALDLKADGAYYGLVLVILAACVAFVSRMQRARLGKAMVAVRDNERASASLGISPARVTVTAFAIGGLMSGLAGGLLVGLLRGARPTDFPAGESLNVISIVVIGGLTSVAGALLGSLWVIGLPLLFDNSVEVHLLTSSVGLLVLLLYIPGGLTQVIYSIRDAVLDVVARRRPEPAPASAGASPAALPIAARTHTRDRRPPAPALSAATATIECRGLRVRFGDRTVLRGVSITVAPSEIVGLIGANGAGKTTLMNAICGFVPCTGDVNILGADASRMSPARRARRGIGRSWQGAELFPDLTVRDTVSLAVRGVKPWSRSQRSEADEVITHLGLGGYANRFVNELSTGTRRIVELSCLIASGSRMLCLDEPTAGLAQRETEAFGPLIRSIRAELDASILVIEHDMPLILGISDRVYCLESGEVIAEGLPAEVRENPLVIASYLGTDQDAINRSGTIAADPPARFSTQRS